MTTASQQLQFDFTRAERYGLIRSAKLPKVQGVSESSMKNVLEALLHHDGPLGICPGAGAISEHSYISESTVKRAVAALTKLSLLHVEDRGQKTNHYTIIWSELAVLIPPKTPPTPKICELTMDDCELTMDDCELTMDPKTYKTQETKKTHQADECVVPLFSHSGNPDPSSFNLHPSTFPLAEPYADELRSIGVGYPLKELQLARANGLTNDQIAERIAAWRAERAASGDSESLCPVGKLVNWLRFPRMYKPAKAESKAQPPLRVNNEGLSGNDICFRSSMIRRWKQDGLEQAEIQTRIARCEAWLRAGRPTVAAAVPSGV